MWINQTATFTCATNVTGYELSFNNIIDVSTTSVNLPGGGKLATASFTVTLESNGTSVRCLADTAEDDAILHLTSLAYAYAQG